MANQPKANSFVLGTLFEEDYLVRTLGSLGYSAEVALTELVANAWDAGATTVDISIPDDYNQPLRISDNGVGLTKDQFHNRWMRLGYNRIKHQGSNVTFPAGVEGKRLAYGRNGVGRHGLLCFNNEYTVTTSSAGEESTFVVTTLSEQQPFVIKNEEFKKTNKHGTTLEVVVTKNLPKADKILEIISARFLHDPNFVVSINRKTVPLEEHAGLIDTAEIKVRNKSLMVHFIDSQKAARTTLYQGIAFWQSGRLVGEPSWILGNHMVIDGRTSFAKRYTVVVKTADLAEFILEDWTGFKASPIMDEVNAEISKYVAEMFTKLAKGSIEETKQQLKKEFAQQFSSLPPLAKFEVTEAIDSLTMNHPTAKPEALSLAVETIINLEKTRSGRELLLKISKLGDDDVTGLNDLLDNWSIRDALSVLDEIDNRISIIEAIRKLSADEDVDELHVLHPLVTAARWLFGPEFESAEFVSNRQLQTAVEAVFKAKVQKSVFNNHKKRPDIIILADSTMSITGTDSFNTDSKLSTVTKVLIIELKRGGFKLTRKERDQAIGYVEDLMNCGSLIGSPYVEAFVVGQSFSEKVQPISTIQTDQNIEMGKVRISTFSQLVDTAEGRLFGLRKKLNERYDDVPGMQLYKQPGVQEVMNLSK